MGDSWLLCRSGGRLCALPLASVVEIMRPLPVDAIAGTPDFVRGVAIVRGAPVPVVELSRLLAGVSEPCARFVTLRTAERLVVLAVAEVPGVRRLPPGALTRVPPLLASARTEALGALGRLDAQFLMVLETAHLLPVELDLPGHETSA